MEQASASPGSGALLTLLFAAVGEVVAIVFVASLLRKGGSPSGTLTWALVILAAPWAGLLLYYLLPRRVQMRRLARRRRTLAWVEGSLDALPEPLGVDARGGSALERFFASADPDAFSNGNQVRLLESGADFFAGAADAIAKARHHVHVQAYILRADATGRMFLRLLADAASRGVEVRLLYDALGSWSLRRRDLQDVVAAGGKAEPAMSLLWRRRPFTFNLRNHRKLVVIDGALGFIGGRNIADEYALDRFGKRRTWFDTMLRIEGPAVARLQRVFVEDWCNATEEDVARREYFPEVGGRGEDQVAIVTGGPDAPTSLLYQTTFQMLTGSEASIDISSPYLVPDATLMTAIQVAARRGVRVRIHTNGPAAAHFFLYHAARSYYRELLEVGAEIVETAGDYNHSKIVIVDRKHCFIGSPNLDTRSFDLNFEVGAVVCGGDVPLAATRMFESRMANGHRVTQDDLPKRRLPATLDGLCRLASPLL